ncbi:alkaline phosphatase D family protein [Propionibacteriaceae bacterium Y1685]
MPDTFMINRRRLLQASGLTAATVALGVRAPANARADEPTLSSDPFTLGVASGAPRTDGMVLWTRLAPDALATDGHGGMPLKPVTVHWEVATDPDFADVVDQGEALAQPELAHAVHPRTSGLEPGTRHHYRFTVGTWRSPVGQFRTLPAAGTDDETFSFGVTSCQAWYHGHFTAHKHLAAERDLDLAVFAGDYIYEYGITEANLWRQGVELDAAHSVEIETLAQYRLRYALFKSDPHLQAVHARAASVNIWDDHEVQNNIVGRSSAYGIPDELFQHRVAVAYRAFYENLPLDVTALPEGPAIDINTGFDVGGLARFSMLDTRQFRDPLPTTEDEKQAEDRTMLGASQEAWIDERLSSSDATWNVLVNSVTFAAINPKSLDSWDGFPAARRRLQASMAKADNPVVLTGDIHRHVAAETLRDFDQPELGNLGVELICTSVGSDGDGSDTDSGAPTWEAHDYVKLYNRRRGYVHVTLTPEEMRSTFVVVPWIQADDTAPRQIAAQFTTPAGDPRLTRI